MVTWPKYSHFFSFQQEEIEGNSRTNFSLAQDVITSFVLFFKDILLSLVPNQEEITWII